MITKNSLRIGNFVSDGHVAVKIRALHDEAAMFENYIGGKMYKYIDPIPLTSEWLLRFGFTGSEPAFDNVDLPYLVKSGVCLFYNSSPPENTYLISQGYSYENIYYAAMIRWIDSVHELQNIYYALTGEELTIKE